MAIVFKQPLVFRESTGTTVEPNNTELFGKVTPSQTTTFSIGQAVGTGSAVVFDQFTVTNKKFIIGDETLILSGSSILRAIIIPGSFTVNRAKIGSSLVLTDPFRIICFKFSKMSTTSSLTFKIVENS